MVASSFQAGMKTSVRTGRFWHAGMRSPVWSLRPL
jgi:hypothetical protein